MKKTETNYERYLNTNSGRRLLEEHSLSEIGTWIIKGEDKNCDFGGSHHQPVLGYRTGKLEDVVAEGVEMSDFWEWGAGGSFELIEIEHVDNKKVKRIVELKQQRAELEKQLKDINKQLGE